MAVRKTATKTSSRAKANIDISMDKKSKNKVKKAVKGSSVKALLLAFVFLIVGLGGGVGVWYLVCRNDCFDLVGSDYVELTLDEKYIDEGVKIVAFGKEDSENFEIETNLKTDAQGNFYSDEVGVFYIKYSSNNFKYGKLFKVEKVRRVAFVEASEQEEIIPEVING